MGRDKVLGVILVGLSVVSAPGLGLLLLRERSLPLIVFAGPAVVFLLGLLFIFTDWLETSLRIGDEIEEMPKLVEDDIQALFYGRITWTHYMVAVTVLTAIVLAALLVWYKKWEASWGPVNVLMISATMVAVTLVVGLRSYWFQRREQRTRRQVFVIPLAGLILSVALGLYCAEPKEFGGQTRSSGFPSEAARWSASRSSDFDILGITGGGNLDLDIDCDGDLCLVLLLVLIVTVCVVSSAFIPHFWVLAGHLLLTIMALIALRDLLASERVQSA
jgi:hypothetical protein